MLELADVQTREPLDVGCLIDFEGSAGMPVGVRDRGKHPGDRNDEQHLDFVHLALHAWIRKPGDHSDSVVIRKS